jgi:hypothetical protein
MTTSQQLDLLVNQLLTLDEMAERADYINENKSLKTLMKITQVLLDNSEVYGDVRNICEDIKANFVMNRQIKYGLVCSDLCAYL